MGVWVPEHLLHINTGLPFFPSYSPTDTSTPPQDLLEGSPQPALWLRRQLSSLFIIVPPPFLEPYCSTIVLLFTAKARSALLTELGRLPCPISCHHSRHYPTCPALLTSAPTRVDSWLLCIFADRPAFVPTSKRKASSDFPFFLSTSLTQRLNSILRTVRL